MAAKIIRNRAVKGRFLRLSITSSRVWHFPYIETNKSWWNFGRSLKGKVFEYKPRVTWTLSHTRPENCCRSRLATKPRHWDNLPPSLGFSSVKLSSTGFSSAKIFSLAWSTTCSLSEATAAIFDSEKKGRERLEPWRQVPRKVSHLAPLDKGLYIRSINRSLVFLTIKCVIAWKCFWKTLHWNLTSRFQIIKKNIDAYYRRKVTRFLWTCVKLIWVDSFAHLFTFVYVCLLEWESNKPAVSTMVTVFPIWRVRFEIESFTICCSPYICTRFFLPSSFYGSWYRRGFGCWKVIISNLHFVLAN